MSDAERLAALFAGNRGCHGTHGTPTWDEEKRKWSIKNTARQVHDAVTVRHWEMHLSGERPLGVIPIAEDSTASWGCGDIDDYDVVATEVIRRLEALKYPMVPVRSKSGGLHLFLFLRSPEPARQVQATVRDMMASLGYARAEVFPKQSELMPDRPHEGNWMVMPYFGGDFGGKLRVQAGLKKGGGEMTLGEFLRAAEAARVTTAEVRVKRAPPSRRTNGPSANGSAEAFADGPPCLQHLAALGVARGGQSNALLMMGIYYKRAYPEDWKAHLEEANGRFLDPPGTAEGLMSVTRSLERKDYEYTCKAEPMVGHCNAAVCRTRPHGVGEAGYFPLINSISKVGNEPVLWIVDIEGRRLELDTAALQDYRLFCRACLSVIDKSYAPMKAADWAAVLRRVLENLTTITPSEDVGEAGQFLELLTEHLTNRTRAARQEDLLGGRPWEDVEGEWGERGTHYLSLPHLMKFLVREGVRDWSRIRVARRIEALGGASVKRAIKGSFRNLWSVPRAVVHPTPGMELPRVKEERI